MAAKNELTIADAIYTAIRGYVKQRITGDVYHKDCRPADSKKEDALVVVSTATADQIQEGRAKVNIFVPDIDNGSGRLVLNKDRLQELATMESDIIQLLNDADSDYLWWLSSMTQFVEDPSTKEHFVNINLGFQIVTFNE